MPLTGKIRRPHWKEKHGFGERDAGARRPWITTRSSLGARRSEGDVGQLHELPMLCTGRGWGLGQACARRRHRRIGDEGPAGCHICLGHISISTSCSYVKPFDADSSLVLFKKRKIRV
ncbi:hypothetical protein PAHAL_9G459900 [Panicum hallii]|uniref:Uncharacterized protein n=1 Tax=Panicum hallii TaxID=206008 RepID=A0A2T8I4T8_9POAL|nr:hypothetical protein PAHAL_9G459900 [Panicum hallii]